MNISDLQKLYSTHPQIIELLSLLPEEQNIFLKGLSNSASSLVTSALFNTVQRNILCVLNDLEDAGYFFYDLSQILGENNVLFFPSAFKRNIKYGQRDAANEILRTEALEKLSNNDSEYIIVTYPEALAEKVIAMDNLARNTLKVSVGEKVDILFIADILDSYRFEYADYVYEPGQYTVRGSIIDVFSYSNEYPYRIDFFGNEVESIRSFDVESQLSKKKLKEIQIVSAQSGKSETTLFSYIKEDTVLIFKNEDWIYEKIESLWNDSPILTNEETFQSLSDIRLLLSESTVIQSEAKNYIKLHLTNPNKHVQRNTAHAIVKFSTEIQPSFHKNFELVARSFKQYLSNGFDLYILSDSEKQINRIQSIFEDRGDNITFKPVLKTIHEGFVDKTLHACFFTDHQLFDRFHKYNLKSEQARSGKIACSLKELQQFHPGDYVVHIDHGIGKFGGLVRTEINGKMQEMIKVVYHNNDTIFVSIHSLHKISRYKSKEGETPRLNKLGSAAWDNLKTRTKNKVKDIAKELILLYSERKKEKGFAFSPDTYLQKELEASFIYEDTPDQEKATTDIKADMESPRPMDRLVCGDVGFGKTEVAIRAAFKAVVDNKQVVVLVPTTLLAYQHYNTFKERLKNFPCNIDYLSRSRKPEDIKNILQKLKSGELDILIGTHRVISKDVVLKDLGLLIIDEEQKFGVSVKEKLKQMRVNVDTLTLTATPIPRTLQFSLMGARDLSSITTPPPNRYPIQTEVHRCFEKDVIREAINFEMSRNGQVFIINNHIQTLSELEALVLKEVPDARVAIAHGRIDPHKMEKMIADFANFEYDVLIATTIIENGIDIPNANTIIINNAHNFGLSDLHQLRGRVGRGNQKAFCYLLAPPLTTLTDEARRRLQAIENFSELGSGFHVAIQDLDIRGAGNMLGAEQSGFIADLGYETYQKILEEAVLELKNEEFADLYKDENNVDKGSSYILETAIESDMELLFPACYIPNDSERISIYRELDSIESESQLDKFRIKLKDRFGEIPKQGEELIQIVHLKSLAKKLGIEKIILKKGKMNIQLVSNHDSPYYQSKAFEKLLNYVQIHYEQCQLKEEKNRRSLIIQHVNSVSSALRILSSLRNSN